MSRDEGPLRGVNLGGWLVLEPWMTPSLFKNSNATDEYTFCAHLAADRQNQLRAHRDTFIVEDDFAWLAAQGIEAVRLPVGYWLFGDVKPYLGTAEYVDKAFEWAARHNIKILLDLHGAPGSQNGRFHSGQDGQLLWATSDEYIMQTLEYIRRIAKRYGSHSALLGISLLNEPAKTIKLEVLEDFYALAYKLVKASCSPNVWIIFSDSFRPKKWYHRLSTSLYPGMHVDYHHYQLVANVYRWSPVQVHLWSAQWLLPPKIRRMARAHPVVVGEWSVALPSGHMKQLSQTRRSQVQKAYAEYQLKAFGSASAWFYWSYKTEGGGAWSFRDCMQRELLSDGWLPNR